MTDLLRGSEQWTKLRDRALNDLFFFADVVLGYGHLVPITPRAHALMCRFAERKTGVPMLDDAWVRLMLVPRGTGKSTLITQAGALQTALKYPNCSILIANEKADGAQKFLAEIKGQCQTNGFLRALFPDRIPENPEKDAEKWSESEATLIRDVSRKEPTFLATGVGGAITGMHPDLAYVDDMLSDEAMENARSGSFQIIEKTNRWINQLRPLVNDAERWQGIFVVGCIAHDEPVLMADGTWKPIQEVVPGDVVWACKKDGSEGFAARTVTAVWPQGESAVVEINVAGRKLICTPEHPILSAEGRDDGVGRTWKTASDLSREHSKNPYRGCMIEVFEGMPGMGKEADLDLYWLLGFLWGDGWVTRCERPNGDVTYSVFFAPGVREERNVRAEALLRKFFGGTPTRSARGRGTRLDNTQAGETLEEWGLTPSVRAPQKRLPAWLFRSRAEGKRAFLRGLGDADGHWTTPQRYVLGTTSKGLTEDVRRLAMTCHVRPTLTNIQHKFVQPPHSPQPVHSTVYTVGLNFLTTHEPLYRYGVKSVTPLALHRPVYDLTIEDGACAFVASGLCVGNTPWWEGDSYTHVEQSFSYGDEARKFTLSVQLEDGSAKVQCYRKGDIAVFRRPILENGTSFFPERWPDEKLAKMRVADPLLYAANMMLDPTAPEVVVFKGQWRRYYDWDGAERVHYVDQEQRHRYVPVADLDCVMSIDPAFTEGGTTSARQAIMVTGQTAEHLYLILCAQATRTTLDSFVSDIVNWCRKVRIRKLLIERVAQQKAFINQVSKALHEASIPITVTEVTPGGRQKDARIGTLEYYFERGLIYAHRNMTDFWQEYDGFPRSKFKDLLDALAYQPEYWSQRPNQETGEERARQERQRLYQRMGVSPAGKTTPDLRYRKDGSSRW